MDNERKKDLRDLEKTITSPKKKKGKYNGTKRNEKVKDRQETNKGDRQEQKKK